MIARLHKTTILTTQVAIPLKEGIARCCLHTDEKDQHIDTHLQRTSRQGILSLDLQAVVDGRAHLGDTTSHEVDVVIGLCLAIHLLVARSEHTYVHIEVENVGSGEHLLELHSLLHTRDTAHLGAVVLTHLLVA